MNKAYTEPWEFEGKKGKTFYARMELQGPKGSYFIDVKCPGDTHPFDLDDEGEEHELPIRVFARTTKDGNKAYVQYVLDQQK